MENSRKTTSSQVNVAIENVHSMRGDLMAVAVVWSMGCLIDGGRETGDRGKKAQRNEDAKRGRSVVRTQRALYTLRV